MLDARLATIAEQQAKPAAVAAHLEHLLTCPSSDPATNCSLLHEVARSRLAGDPVTLELLVARAADDQTAARPARPADPDHVHGDHGRERGQRGVAEGSRPTSAAASRPRSGWSTCTR